MRLTQALLIGVLAVGVTTPVFAEDGYDLLPLTEN